MIMITNAFSISRSEYVLGRPRGRVAGSHGQTRAAAVDEVVALRSLLLRGRTLVVGV